MDVRMPSSLEQRDGSAEVVFPTIWGLEATDLHDAWWRSRGVQCVYIGSGFEPVPGAELYLLLQPTQMAVFDLAEIAEAMVWNQARATRVRIVERDSNAYAEKVRLTSSGDVLGVGRHYSPSEVAVARVILVTSPHLAAEWGHATDHHDARRRIKAVGRDRLASVRVTGHCFDATAVDDHKTMLRRLVAVWQNPERVIAGIEELAPGVFGPRGARAEDGEEFIAPVWLGFRSNEDSLHWPVVGPEMVQDACDLEYEALRLRNINEIIAPRGRGPARLLPSATIYTVLKRGFDVVVALAVLIAFLPIFLAVSILIVLDDGFPVLFGHVRQSRDGTDFRCWKFRTMRRDAESLVGSLKAENEADGPQVFIRNDPRVTRLGRLLRKLQIDELPQFWNVLVGDMSVVGPRPSPDSENQFCPAWRELRLSVRPGITGLWQVERTRSPGLDFQEWIRFDIEYVRRASLWLDIKICIKTLTNLIRNR